MKWVTLFWFWATPWRKLGLTECIIDRTEVARPGKGRSQDWHTSFWALNCCLSDRMSCRRQGQYFWAEGCLVTCRARRVPSLLPVVFLGIGHTALAANLSPSVHMYHWVLGRNVEFIWDWHRGWHGPGCRAAVSALGGHQDSQGEWGWLPLLARDAAFTPPLEAASWGHSPQASQSATPRLQEERCLSLFPPHALTQTWSPVNGTVGRRQGWACSLSCVWGQLIATTFMASHGNCWDQLPPASWSHLEMQQR